MGVGSEFDVDRRDGSEIMVNRILTGAHYGLRDWLVQRVTAVVMAVYALAIVVYLLIQPSFGYDTWAELFSGNVVRSFSLLFLLLRSQRLYTMLGRGCWRPC